MKTKKFNHNGLPTINEVFVLFVKKALPDLGVGLGLKYSVPNVT